MIKSLINNIKGSIKNKLQLFVLSSTLIIFLLTILYVSQQARNSALREAERLTTQMANKHAATIQSELNKDFELTRTMAVAIQDFVLYPDSLRELVVPKMLKRVIEQNQHLLSIWMHWELAAIIDNYPYNYGRVRKNFYRQDGIIKYKEDTVDTEGDNEEGLYYRLKTTKQNVIAEPYWYSYTKNQDDAILETSITIPVLQSTKFLGLMGIDLQLDRFKELIKQVKPFNDSYAFFISHGGTFIYHPDSKNIGGNLITDNLEDNEKYHIEDNIESGKTFSFVRTKKGEKHYVVFSPVYIGDTTTPWYLSVVVPEDEMVAEANKNMFTSLIIGVIGILILGVILWFISVNISRPLIKISHLIEEIAKGKIKQEQEKVIKTRDEIGLIAEHVYALNNNLFKTAQFANEIGKGNLNAEFEKLSDDDLIGNALFDMRKNLQKAQDEENKRKEEDQIQRWSNQGTTQINEIMRNQLDINELSYNVIKFIADYLDVNQGSMFIRVEEDITQDKDSDEGIYFEPTAVLAWGRKKPLHIKIRMGETLIGRAAYEKSTMYMIDIPEDYVNITSGLGKSNPTALLIVPLILNEEVLGIIEMVSFHTFEQHQIEFVEKTAVSIASTIASVKINQRTNALLTQTKQQAGELQEKEEEMRQQMEEMQATQEEAAKREAEMSGMITAINSIAFVAEYDMDGIIINVNDAYAQLLGMPRQQILGKKQGFFEEGEDQEKIDAFNELWSKLKRGIPFKQEQKIILQDKSLWLSEVYTPIRDKDGMPVKVINIAMDISHLKEDDYPTEDFSEPIE